MFLQYNTFGIAWTLIIIVVSLLPGHSIPSLQILWLPTDGFVHMMMYGILSFLVTVGLLKQSSYLFLRVYAASVAVFYANALGVLMEVLQVLATDRNMEAMDVLFNGIGSMLGFLVFYLVYKY